MERRGSQKNGDVRKTVAQQFHKFIHLIVVHIYIITPIMAFIGSELSLIHIYAKTTDRIWLDSKEVHQGEYTWKMMKVGDVKASAEEISSLGYNTVSYTHLDVYKRQCKRMAISFHGLCL